ncbi:hypothetical protein QCA50_007668 [Cerrena zonata]|uniref:F-box domain-containing protein n=1 Tax=Cerrena zonata TaxID=2478898 RepID=A0AAW0GG76_9APHY
MRPCLNECPPEIIQYIFSFACTDNGYTGRSLSLVSHFINEVAKPICLQSVALYTLDQVGAFNTYLHSRDPHHRIVRSLYITLGLREGQWDSEDWSRTNDYLPTLKPLLEIVAPHLRRLSVSLSAWKQENEHLEPPFSLFDVHFPSLKEFTYHGTRYSQTSHPHFITPQSRASYHVEALNVISTYTTRLSKPLLTKGIHAFAPKLSYLCIIAHEQGDSSLIPEDNIEIPTLWSCNPLQPNSLNNTSHVLERIDRRRAVNGWFRCSVINTLTNLSSGWNSFDIALERYWLERNEGGRGIWDNDDTQAVDPIWE